ncbi:hypothetical protein I3843_12G046900 [Carya illinoinensis]|nr:hypothetical protein I3843_12G046900 [Carya illinoinensis]
MSANRQSHEPPHFYGWHGHSKLQVQYITLQAQQEYPPDMQCKDKFLLQSTIVPPHTDVDELPQDTFNKDSGRAIEECKLKVLYISPASAHANSENQALAGSTQSPDTNSLTTTKCPGCVLIVAT